MKTTLIEQLDKLIRDDYPELLSCHEGKKKLRKMLELVVQKLQESELPPETPVTDKQIAALFESVFGPSRFHYVKRILKKEFETDYLQIQLTGFTDLKLSKLTWACMAVFEAAGFTSVTDDNTLLRYAIIGALKDHLKNGLIANYPFS